ncbi:hypothetical protein B484DRAFT_394816, partial [Ochromonadaceae sp. CCMP2298]
MAYSHKHLVQCAWFSDLVNADPLSLINHLSTTPRALSAGIAVVHTYSTLRRFDVEVLLPYTRCPQTVALQIPIAQFIHSLHPQPLLLAAFLWELAVNEFSPQSLSHLYARVDWEVPGQ